MRANLNYSNASSVNFTVTFDEFVTGVDTGDFTITASGISGSSVGSVSADSGATRTVAVNTGSGAGTLRLDLIDDDSIQDAGGNPLGGSGAGDGNFITGQVYTFNETLGVRTPYFLDVPYDYAGDTGWEKLPAP